MPKKMGHNHLLPGFASLLDFLEERRIKLFCKERK